MNVVTLENRVIELSDWFKKKYSNRRLIYKITHDCIYRDSFDLEVSFGGNDIEYFSHFFIDELREIGYDSVTVWFWGDYCEHKLINHYMKINIKLHKYKKAQQNKPKVM